MKKTRILIITAILLALTVCATACGKGTDGGDTGDEASSAVSADASNASDAAEPSAPKLDPAEVKLNISPVTDEAEAEAYYKIVVHGDNKDFIGKETSKTGMFCVLRDQFNGRDRYYVWGYGNSERSVDWQWEFDPANVSALPVQGSVITVTGKLESSDDALDRIWIADASAEVTTAYTPEDGYDVDCRFMGSTLERVQVQNVNLYPDYFSGKTIAVYGRSAGEGGIRNPYDGAEGSIMEWSVEFDSEYKNPQEGTLILLTGTVADGHIHDGIVSIIN